MKPKKVITTLIIAASATFQIAFADSAPAPKPMEVVDTLFRELRTASASRRIEIIDAISTIGKTNASTNDPMLPSYGFNPKNRAVLAEAIPVLIDTLDGTAANKAWGILICIQGSCPEPKKEVWQRWWKETGQKRFTAEKTNK
ncbi:MAG: hypothetical protein ABI318_14375 [Chthoniobacteraceae bacterium]